MEEIRYKKKSGPSSPGKESAFLDEICLIVAPLSKERGQPHCLDPSVSLPKQLLETIP